jgi:hypothetical protein
MLNDLNASKHNFIKEVLNQSPDEGPFSMSYALDTSFCSDTVLSLLGKIYIFDHLPHGYEQYEGLTFYKENGKYIPIALEDLFSTPTQKEWLRKCCEDFLKTDSIPSSYFVGETPLLTSLDSKLIHTFVLEPDGLCIIFQPYTVAGGTDGPPVIKIPYKIARAHWNASNPLIRTGYFS